MLFLELFFGYLAADLLTGVVHWMEDTYEVPDHVLCFNREHHIYPSIILKKSMWSNIREPCILFILGFPFLVYFNLSRLVIYMFFFGVFGNLVHRFSHIPPHQSNIFIKILQEIGLVQRFETHKKHHDDPTGYYCVMTEYLNPLLEWFKFWRFLEMAIYSVFGFQARVKSDIEIYQNCKNNEKLK